MRFHFLGLAWAGCFLVASVPAVVSAEKGPVETTTVVVVRHAEKAASGDDPALTEAGRERAAALARAVVDLGPTRVFATPFRRTQETAVPVARNASVDITVIEPTPEHPETLASELRRGRRGEAVVVVGHSNTVPAIAAALGCADVPAMGDHQYDDFWLISFSGDRPPRCHHLHYGRPTP